MACFIFANDQIYFVHSSTCQALSLTVFAVLPPMMLTRVHVEQTKVEASGGCADGIS